jgi:hypothetical protein
MTYGSIEGTIHHFELDHDQPQAGETPKAEGVRRPGDGQRRTRLLPGRPTAGPDALAREGVVRHRSSTTRSYPKMLEGHMLSRRRGHSWFSLNIIAAELDR